MVLNGMTGIRDRVAGVLFGLAAGDRIGGPVRMAVRLAESLLHCHAFDLDDIGSRYLDWWRDGAFDTGPTAARIFSLVASGNTFSEATSLVHDKFGGLTAGCNPVHRATPLAMSVALADDDLPRHAWAEASLTHKHPLVGDVSAAAVALCRALINGYDWPTAITIASLGRLEETQAALMEQPPEALHADGFAPHVLAAAVHFVASNPDFDAMLDHALAFAGPANYCPVLASSIGGAKWGASSMSSEWFRNGEIMPRVRQAADGLAAAWK
jgi:ADP-ribosyl-[dinitrogen reductase] hydrolase